MSHEACYLPLGDAGPHGGECFRSTRLSAAEWYPDGQHGGVVSALLTRAVENRPSLAPMEISRVTVELFRVVPVTDLEVVVDVVREGKRIQTCQVQLYQSDVELARGLIQRLRVADLDLPMETMSEGDRPPGPEGLEHLEFTERVPFPDDGQITFGRRAVEVREARGSFRELGPAAVWFRFTHPLVAGEPMSPTQRAVIAADFSNGMTRLASGREWVFMNSDLSVHLARLPRSEWVAIDGESVWSRAGRGTATSHLYDEDGPIGRATQTLFLDHAPGTG